MAISSQAINDGEWHVVEFRRQRNAGVVTGELIIDETEAIPVSWPEGGATALNINTPVYIGGLNMQDVRYRYMAQKIGPSSAASLVGCIDKIQYRTKESADGWLSYGTESNAVNTQACFDDQEDGAFIPASDGYLAVGKSLPAQLKCLFMVPLWTNNIML